MLCGLIMAGGKGQRLFPLSTEKKPKQFLELCEDNCTMIQSTFKRLCGVLPVERIFVITNEDYVQLVKEQLPELPESNIIPEPLSKSTSAAILLSVLHIKGLNVEVKNIVIIPSDHLIGNEEKFCESINIASQFISNNKNPTVLVGVPALNPNTAFGYIKCVGVSELKELQVYKVEKFQEKPEPEIAKLFFESKLYSWNTGISVWSINTLLESYIVHQPVLYKQISDCFENGVEKVRLNHVYNNIESISIDHAIIENLENCYMIQAHFDWDDLGSWSSIERNLFKDKMNNILVGDIRIVSSSNSIVYAKEKPVILCNIDNLIVVETDDFIYVGNKDDHTGTNRNPNLC
ncbi:mannose-1-phosphate guanylyltransferase [Paenibacillus polymyxa]|uniref:mannose-1-phosphate guanylyltransferase n=1 Tax=Paenibacillus polymyxa TaxID=1406 RepID=UPI001BE6FB76|nr:sugar phosphate nucleotidyltransferase [Paenibacillus polymyxa]MBT2282944.1 mannose-1-phosphate guanylyltransferase [Paenibacillus polymyxa]